MHCGFMSTPVHCPCEFPVSIVMAIHIWLLQGIRKMKLDDEEASRMKKTKLNHVDVSGSSKQRIWIHEGYPDTGFFVSGSTRRFCFVSGSSGVVKTTTMQHGVMDVRECAFGHLREEVVGEVEFIHGDALGALEEETEKFEAGGLDDYRGEFGPLERRHGVEGGVGVIQMMQEVKEFVGELKHLCLLMVLFSKLPQAFLNDFSLYACTSHSNLNMGMPLWSISISYHQGIKVAPFYCEEKIRWNGNSRSHVLVDESLMFKLLPL
ncbi:hypothetical protein V8G54_024423 [Vigna mungo]|uniref:Uncharacterized protein n=1 Tax=Vigna mungo TaxID=3915 RepID=A0AAQ3RRA4_VIGMU